MAGWSIIVPRSQVERADPLIFGTPGAPGVLSYSAHDTTTHQRWTVTPLGAVTVTVDLTTPDRFGLPRSPVNGLHDRPMTAEQAGHAVGVSIGLAPHAAHALFGPLRELANTTVGLADLLGQDAHRIAEQLAESPTWPARFQLLDRLLTARITRGRHPEPRIRHAWQRLHHTGGRLRIADLADEIGWTRQNLTTRFRDHLGLNPKSAARVLRLHRAATLLPTTPPATVAADCGYADQPHLNRDFRALTGITPTTYAG